VSALAVALSREGVRSAVSDARLTDAARIVLRAENVRHALISITLVTAPRIAALNATHLKHRGPTDVISFGFSRDRGGPLVADIYIAPAVARENAKRHGVGIREEHVRLVVHGVLHALGYDHPDGDARFTSSMWRRQEVLVRRSMKRRASKRAGTRHGTGGAT
jgi:probable rRNA maturation factor